MALVSSLFTAISGLRNHQTLLDVISNNISNVNTTGFKAGRVQFRDMLSQTISSARAANASSNMGGVNPMQTGTGVTVASIDTLQTQGALQSTGVATDMALNGDGFFMVKSGSQTSYTRAGSFRFDAAGSLVDSSGALVQGWTAQTDPADPMGQLVVDSSRTTEIGNITLNAGTTLRPQETRNVELVGNLDAGSTAVNCANSYGQAGTTQIRSWSYDNVAAAWVSTDYVVGQHQVTFGVYDSLGNAHNMTMTLTNLSGTRINGSIYNPNVPIEENVYQDNTWAWEVSSDVNDGTTHLALDNSWFVDPTDPTGTSIVRSASSGMINFTTTGGVNWVAYADRNAQRFGTSSTGTANDPTVPGGQDNDNPADLQLPPVGFVPPGPGAEGSVTDRWADIADADMSNNSIIGFEGAIVPGQNLIQPNPNYDVNNPGAVVNPDDWDNPSFQLRDSTGAFLFANQCEDLTKLPFVLVYQNVPRNSATPPSTVSAGTLVDLQVGNNNMPVGGPPPTTMESWYVQAVDFDWGSVSTITKADFDRASLQGPAPAIGRAGENDTFNDGAIPGVNGDYNTGFSFPWDPYVTSDNSGARDGMTQDATGEWRLINGVNTYCPVFTAHMNDQDGYAEGVLQSVSVDTTGMVIGGFSNGIQQNMAKLALASFENPAGLAKLGETHFTPTANSGNAVVGTALTGGRGSVVGGVLEQSNVDLTVELTNMIVAQRGFEVNARVITTSNNILDTLVNLGR